MQHGKCKMQDATRCAKLKLSDKWRLATCQRTSQHLTCNWPKSTVLSLHVICMEFHLQELNYYYCYYYRIPIDMQVHMFLIHLQIPHLRMRAMTGHNSLGAGYMHIQMCMYSKHMSYVKVSCLMLMLCVDSQLACAHACWLLMYYTYN